MKNSRMWAVDQPLLHVRESGNTRLPLVGTLHLFLYTLSKCNTMKTFTQIGKERLQQATYSLPSLLTARKPVAYQGVSTKEGRNHVSLRLVSSGREGGISVP